MTFLASSATALFAQITLWTGRANQAWGTSRVWNSGSSFETDLAAMTASRNTWQTNANNAWGPSRVYNSGASFETQLAAQVAQYNALLAGLNSPDGEGTVALSWPSLPVGSGDTTTITLTIPRNGHYVVGAYVDGQVAMNSFGAGVDAILTGIIAATKTSNGWSNTGSPLFHQGWVQHGDYTAGQTLSAHLHCAFINGGNASGLLYAHFVPNATYHN